jgi:hypothetical protein
MYMSGRYHEKRDELYKRAPNEGLNIRFNPKMVRSLGSPDPGDLRPFSNHRADLGGLHTRSGCRDVQ